MPKTAASSAIAAMLAGSAFGVVCAQLELTATGEAPRRILLFPMGEVTLRDGRGPFELTDKAHGEAVIAATKARLGKTDFPFDYDHQMVFAAVPGIGGRAEASGWCAKSFEVDDQGIWANVDWTDEAAAAIVARKYRYISPVFYPDAGGKKLGFIRNAALVNQPAIDLEAIAASLVQPETSMKAIALALGLDAAADEPAIIAAIEKAKTPVTIIPAAIAAALALDPAADEAAVVASIGTLKAAKAAAPDPAEFVPMSMFKDQQAQVASLTEVRHGELIAAATTAGKLPPADANQAWAKQYLADKGEAAFIQLMDITPVVVAPGKTPAGKISADPETLTDDERAVCASFNLTEAEYIASRKQLQGAN